MIFKGADFDFSSRGETLAETDGSGNTLNEYTIFETWKLGDRGQNLSRTHRSKWQST